MGRGGVGAVMGKGSRKPGGTQAGTGGCATSFLESLNAGSFQWCVPFLLPQLITNSAHRELLEASLLRGPDIPTVLGFLLLHQCSLSLISIASPAPA